MLRSFTPPASLAQLLSSWIRVTRARGRHVSRTQAQFHMRPFGRGSSVSVPAYDAQAHARLQNVAAREVASAEGVGQAQARLEGAGSAASDAGPGVQGRSEPGSVRSVEMWVCRFEEAMTDWEKRMGEAEGKLAQIRSTWEVDEPLERELAMKVEELREQKSADEWACRRRFPTARKRSVGKVEKQLGRKVMCGTPLKRELKAGDIEGGMVEREALAPVDGDGVPYTTFWDFFHDRYMWLGPEIDWTDLNDDIAKECAQASGGDKEEYRRPYTVTQYPSLALSGETSFTDARDDA